MTISRMQQRRQQYGLGSLVKSLGRGVKKIGKGIKKFAKSDIGKMAITAALMGAPFGAQGGAFGGAKWFGQGSGFGAIKGGLGSLGGSLFGQAGSRVGESFVPYKQGLWSSMGDIGKTAAVFGGGSLIGALMSKAESGDEEAIGLMRNQDALRSYLDQGYRNLKSFQNDDGSVDEVKLNEQITVDMSEYENKADGGRVGLYGGGDPVQAAGLMGLPTRMNKAGVNELDLRNTGGFIPPVGVKEKADDVPAMLSNNEFVMTADAVKAAGGGSAEKGAQVMYDQMKRLEGKVV